MIVDGVGMGDGSAGPCLYLLVPCLNEAGSISEVLGELPRVLVGFARVCILVADDGSVDDSAALARRAGAEVLALPRRGLAPTYREGLRECVRRGADYVVTVDADGQYDPARIPELLGRLVDGSADLVLGERGASFHRGLSTGRRALHSLGALVMRGITRLPVSDPVTGFRAYSRRVASSMPIESSYSYSLETLLHAARLGLRVAFLPLASRPTLRPSRLFRHPLEYVARQSATVVSTLWRNR